MYTLSVWTETTIERASFVSIHYGSYERIIARGSLHRMEEIAQALPEHFQTMEDLQEWRDDNPITKYWG